MSDASLLIYGCAVSFIAAAGFYVYIRECFTEAEAPVRKREADQAEVARKKLRDVS